MQTATRGPALAQRAEGRVGTSAPRIDGTPKVLGSFEYGSDQRLCLGWSQSRRARRHG